MCLTRLMQEQFGMNVTQNLGLNWEYDQTKNENKGFIRKTNKKLINSDNSGEIEVPLVNPLPRSQDCVESQPSVQENCSSYNCKDYCDPEGCNQAEPR